MSERASASLVLVVDDDPDMLLLCGLHLRGAGFEVREAASGAEAIAGAETNSPAVIVLDFMLPDMDGIEVLAVLGARDATAAIPVVMLTARTDARDQQSAWEAGVFDYVTKPFDKDRLVEAVTAALKPGNGEEAHRRRTTALARLLAHDADTWQQLAAIIESSDDAVVGKTVDGIITSWNPAAERLYGYGADEVIGRPISVLASPDHLDEMPDILRRIADGERIDHFETIRQHRDGHLVYVSLAISPIHNSAGRVVGASTIARDLTARRQADVRFQAVVDAAPDAMMIVGAGGFIELVNHQTEKLFGYDRAELLGQPVETLVPERFRAKHLRYREVYSAAPLARPMGAGVDLYGLRKDGTEFPLEISLSPLETDHGVVTLAAVRDVTERRRAEAMFRGLLEAAPDAMVIVDATGRIQLVNAQTEKLFGYDRHDLIGQPVEVLVPQRFRPRHAQHRIGYTATPRARHMGNTLDLNGLRKDGTEFPVEISLSPLETEQGMVISAAVRDVTERKAAENARTHALLREREASQRLRELDRLRSDFLSTVSHELRTPLAAISGFAEVLSTSSADMPETERADLIERIVSASARLDYLMSDLLDFARLERGQLKITPERQHLGLLVDAVLARVGPVLENHQLTTAVDGELSVLADPTAFSRALENLLSNAAKFSPKGSEITLSAHADDHEVAISVADGGPGIPAGELDRIFDRFYRVGGSTNRLPGTGIGLAIVKEFTEAQGGYVESTSTEGHGSTFTIHLPSADPGPPGGET